MITDVPILETNVHDMGIAKGTITRNLGERREPNLKQTRKKNRTVMIDPTCKARNPHIFVKIMDRIGHTPLTNVLR